MPVEWGDPPPGDRRRTAWDEVADELRTRPGVWALVARDRSPATARSITMAMLSSFQPAGTFEARTANRNKEKNRCDIYARFVGDAGRE